MSNNRLASGVLCAVQTCKASKQTHPTRKFFKFPTNQIHLLDVWVAKCALKKKSLANKFKVCEKHFDINYIGKKKLLKDSVPEYYLYDPDIKCGNEIQSIKIEYDCSTSLQTLNYSMPLPIVNEYKEISEVKAINIKDNEGSKSSCGNSAICSENNCLKEENVTSHSSNENLINKMKMFVKIIKYYKGQIDFLKNEIRKLRINKSVSIQIDSLPNLSSAAKEFGKMVLNDSTKDWPCTKCLENIKVAIQLKEDNIINSDMIDLVINTIEGPVISNIESSDDKESVNTELMSSLVTAEQFEDSSRDSVAVKSNDDEDEGTVEQSFLIKGEMYECEKCDAKTHTYKQLLDHMRFQHPDINLYECERCGKEFRYLSLYRNHARVYKLEKPCICKICKKGFKGLKDLRQHNLTHKTEKIHPCPYCDKIFCHKKGLHAHSFCHKEKRILCPKCDTKFQYNSQLKMHMAMVHRLGIIKRKGQKVQLNKKIKLRQQSTCEICGKLLASEISLKRHIKQVHKGEKPFPCSYCSKTFISSVALKCHMQHHINSKNSSMDPKTMESLLKYKCDECDKAFTSSQFLKNHKIIHSGLKAHICAHCGKGFAFKNYLERHIRLVHDTTDPRNFICGICRKVSANVWCFNSHMLSHTGENPFHCKFCESKFRYAKSLRIHMRNKHEPKN